MPQLRGSPTEGEIQAILDFIKASWGWDERMYQWEQTVRSERSG